MAGEASEPSNLAAGLANVFIADFPIALPIDGTCR